MKTCKKCSEEKEISEFGKNRAKIDGIDIYCKKCNLKKTKEYCANNKEKVLEASKHRRAKNKDKTKGINKEYYVNNKEKIKERVKNYENNNKEKISIYKKKYRQTNNKRLKEYDKKRRQDANKENMREYFRVYRNKKRKSDVIYSLKGQIRHRISEGLKSKGFRKNKRTEDILGCTIKDFKSYIESKFETWMNWDNRGLYNGELNYGWDIDHIIPLSSAKTEEEVILLCNYKNLQPLCSYTNRYIKMDHFIGQFVAE